MMIIMIISLFYIPGILTSLSLFAAGAVYCIRDVFMLLNSFFFSRNTLKSR